MQSHGKWTYRWMFRLGGAANWLSGLVLDVSLAVRHSPHQMKTYEVFSQESRNAAKNSPGVTIGAA